jgi:hypothetical protein
MAFWSASVPLTKGGRGLFFVDVRAEAKTSALQNYHNLTMHHFGVHQSLLMHKLKEVTMKYLQATLLFTISLFFIFVSASLAKVDEHIVL